MSIRHSIVGLLGSAAMCAAAGAQCEPGELHKLTADPPAFDARMGGAVALEGGLALVAAAEERTGDWPIGAVYFFDAATGARLARVPSPRPRVLQYFGTAVALRGNFALVGTWGEEGDGVFGYDISDPTLPILMIELQPDDAPVDSFGRALAVADGLIAVGAQDDNERRGAVYVFDAGSLTQLFKLTASDGAPEDLFGWSVAIGGGYILVGAMWYDDGDRSNSGAAYVFDAATGQQLRRLEPSNPRHFGRFGSAVAVNGTAALIGAPGEYSPSQYDGAVYLYDIGTGQEVGKVVGPESVGGFPEFGLSIAAAGGLAVIGSPGPIDPGAAYLYDISDPAAPVHAALLRSGDSAPGDLFGLVAIDGQSVLVGASGESSTEERAGAAYLFPTECQCPGDFNGDGTVNTLDVLAFLNAWAAGDSSADFNGDGTVNTLDVLAFLNAWVAGC